jgi:arginine decarboxylase
LIYKKYFVVSGKGISKKSQVNAFDAALINAGLNNVNIIKVSSIIPPNSKEIEPKKIDNGAMVFTVLGENYSYSGKEIAVGMAYGWAVNGKEKIGLVVTEKQSENEKNLDVKLEEKIKEMAENRKMKLLSFKIKKISLKVPKDHYGCVITVFVYC